MWFIVSERVSNFTTNIVNGRNTYRGINETGIYEGSLLANLWRQYVEFA